MGMRELTGFEESLIDEYYRYMRSIEVNEKAIIGLPQGYVSMKNIKGKLYPYLQKRVDGRVKSTYIPQKDLEAVVEGVAERKRRERNIKEMRENMRKIEKAVGMGLIRQYEQDYRTGI